MQTRPYQTEDLDSVNTLIRGIQSQEQNLNLPQPELRDIENFYQKKGNFWVALDQGQIIGTVALVLLDRTTAKLGKMFVAATHRGGSKQVAKNLLETAVRWAQFQGITHLCLETITEPCAAQTFYLKNNFVEVLQSQLPNAFKPCPYPSRYFIRKLEATI